MWWLTVLIPATDQMCHGDLDLDTNSVVCDGAGRVLKEPFCLLFRATLRKLRPEDMFETWVSTCGWGALHPLLASSKKQTHSGYQTTSLKLQPLSMEKQKTKKQHNSNKKFPSITNS